MNFDATLDSSIFKHHFCNYLKYFAYFSNEKAQIIYSWFAYIFSKACEEVVGVPDDFEGIICKAYCFVSCET